MVASAVLGLVSTASYAEEEKKEDADNKTIEVIEVKGMRSNMISAQDMKFSADTVLDAISAEDMGSMPDRSVLEAISRLPGVAIERFAAADDPDHFGVEGGGVVVRGLTQVRSEFNHRDTFSANSGRGLSFEDVSPELMGSVEVFKNQTADMIEGGIAGTVSLNTRKPFDNNGRAFAFTADATYTDMREETSPTFSALYSDIIEADDGSRFGFLLNYSDSELKVRSDGVQVGLYEEQGRQMDGKAIYVPRSTRLSKKEDDRTREGFAASVQFENADKTLLLTGEYIRSEATLAWAENVMEMDDGDSNKSLLPVAGTEFEFDDNGYFEKGVITSEAGWRGDGSDGRTGMQHTMQTRAHDEKSEVSDYSFNAKFTPNDTWSFQWDVQFVEAEMSITDVSVMGAARAVVGMDLSGSGLPKIDIHGKTFDNQSDYQAGMPFTDTGLNFFRSAMDHVSENTGEEFATRLDGKYTFDDGFFRSISAGVRYSDREQTTKQSDYNWGALSEAWTGNGIQWYDETEVPHDSVVFDDFARGGVIDVEGGAEFLFPSMAMVQNYGTLTQALDPLDPSEWKRLSQRDGATQGHFKNNEINETSETNTAAYIRFDFEGELGGMDYSSNFGLRYVKLENDTAGFLVFPDDVPKSDTDLANYLPADQAAFGDGASSKEVATSDYSNVLPSFNFKLNFNDELLIRLGISEAISLPRLGLLRNYVDMQGDSDSTVTTIDPNVLDPDTGQPQVVSHMYTRYTASSGNPNLKPMEAINYDLSFEYYFAESSSLVLSLFYKDLENYFINGVDFREYTNNGSTQQVQVSGAINGGKGKVKGYEIAYQQFFDQLPGVFSGLGVQLNYTSLSEEGSPNAGLNDSAPAGDSDGDAAGEFAFTDLPLEGLSEQSANAAVLYEKHGLSARIAYNWRDQYLLTTRDVITSLPIYNEAGGQLDASVFWDVSDNWKIGLQGTNLNNNVTETLMQINQAGDKKTRSWFTNDRRFSLVVRGNF